MNQDQKVNPVSLYSSVSGCAHASWRLFRACLERWIHLSRRGFFPEHSIAETKSFKRFANILMEKLSWRWYRPAGKVITACNCFTYFSRRKHYLKYKSTVRARN